MSNGARAKDGFFAHCMAAVKKYALVLKKRKFYERDLFRNTSHFYGIALFWKSFSYKNLCGEYAQIETFGLSERDFFDNVTADAREQGWMELKISAPMSEAAEYLVVSRKVCKTDSVWVLSFPSDSYSIIVIYVYCRADGEHSARAYRVLL